MIGIKEVVVMKKIEKKNFVIFDFLSVLAEVLYNVKNGSPFITSKSSSKNLSYENKHSLFFQRIGIFFHILSGSQQKH